MSHYSNEIIIIIIWQAFEYAKSLLEAFESENFSLRLMKLLLLFGKPLSMLNPY